jgi:hypothetical protein
MRARKLNKNSLVTLALMACVWGGFATVRAADQHPVKIEFSEAPAHGAEVVSNLNRLNSDQSTFNQVKEDLLRPFGSFNPRNALNLEDFANEQLPPPRPAQGMMSKHAQDLLDKKRNWAFSTYEELFSPDEAEKQMFGIKEYGDDGREKQSVSAIDKYYESLNGNNSSLTNLTPDQARAEFVRQNGFDPLGKSLQPGDPFLKEMYGLQGPDAMDKISGAESPELVKVNFSAIGSPEDIRIQQKRLNDLRRNVLGDTAARLDGMAGRYGSLLTTDQAYLESTKKSSDNLMKQQLSDAAALRLKSANPFLVTDPTANALYSHVNDDLTARALGLPNPTKPQTNNVTRPTPTAQSIEAEWDPFSANRAKPRF